ncbi:hypothetical protein FGU65_13835 [Methanoculleus sp. FWC-SCC1]|uniref:GNAT family N-acetyltransferase n=1 Tax=Methanoculleus frigidifontis TaxID=2584085 RepID=A0ABT8MDI2_9EURY|nr:hypothetical protein [Methanoculleus sp. FWC-SCC1]MDN7025951.1 hypothetical protein [Methanoculleus sp. FWC-SCC1]
MTYDEQIPEYPLWPIGTADRTAVIDLFNYYVENTFAAYPEQGVPYEFFEIFLATCRDYPSVAVEDADGRFLGFGMLRLHNPIPAFAHTAEITCFIDPGGFRKTALFSKVLYSPGST